MLNRWKIPIHFTGKPRTLVPLASLIFTKLSVSTAKLENVPVVQSPGDTVSEIVTGLKILGFRKFIGGDYFKGIVSDLNQPQVDSIIDQLRIDKPELALGFFQLLSCEYDFRHSRVSRFSISYVLASSKRLKDLCLIIKQMVDEEGIAFGIFLFTMYGLLDSYVDFSKILGFILKCTQ